jgi:adenylate kinase
MVSITLLGPPGVGKGTQGEMLSRELGFKKISTGDILRDNVSRKSELGLRAERYMNRGELVPDELIIEMVSDALRGGGDFILDGFPRNIEQAKAVDVDLAILMEVSDSVVMERLSFRRICPSCHTLYHLKNRPPKRDGRCDRCGSELVQRSDDRPEVINDRLRVYREGMDEVIKFYEEKGKLIRVNGEGDAERIGKAMLDILRGYSFFEHTADIGIEAWGYSLAEMLRQGGLAMAKLMAPDDKIEGREEEEMEVEGEDEELLVNFLSELLFLRDTKDFVAGSIDIRLEEGEGLKAEIKAKGETYDASRHGYGYDIKAVTYHMLKVEKDVVYRARVLLDI